MKIKKLFLVLFMIFPLVLFAQEETFGDFLKQAGEAMKEHQLNNQTESANDQVGNNEQNQNNRSSIQNDENLENWKNMFEENLEPLKETMRHFNTKETSCIFLMVIYLDSYFDLLDKIEATEACRVKSDLYGLQSLAIATSTTFMYCPEGLWNMTIDEREAVYTDDLVPILRNSDNDPSIEAWKQKLRRVTATDEPAHNQSPYGGDMIYRMCAYFSPGYILPTLLKIQQEIEALGCPD